MSNEDTWLLPEGIEELLPPQAAQLEQLRRTLLDCYRSWGYELVMPPFVEYLESLLTGAGGDLDLQTFKIIDPMTGRLMGLRADMTPQAARIDAHQLRRKGQSVSVIWARSCAPIRRGFRAPVRRCRWAPNFTATAASRAIWRSSS